MTGVAIEIPESFFHEKDPFNLKSFSINNNKSKHLIDFLISIDNLSGDLVTSKMLLYHSESKSKFD